MPHRSRSVPLALLLMALGVLADHRVLRAEYVNFEVSHVHPIDATPSGHLLLAVNTPDALLEVFTVQPDGRLLQQAAIPVGMEPVSVVARSDTEAWVVNHLSDTVSVVDLAAGVATRTLAVGDEPNDVAFLNNRAFVSLATEDRIRVYDLADLDLPPVEVPLFGRKPRALDVWEDTGAGEQIVYAVVQDSGNQTTVVDANVINGNDAGLNPARLAALGLTDIDCDGAPPPYPPLPPGIVRNPALIDPADGIPKVSLIVRWDGAAGQWRDEAGQDWSHCLPYRLPDHDLFAIDAASLAVTEVDRLGTTLFEVAVKPDDGTVWVPNTEARNFVRFEHPLGVRGHMVDNRLSVVDPDAGPAVNVIDLNSHIDRASDPSLNLAERLASISQPGDMEWRSDGSAAYLTAIGSRKLFRVAGACTAGPCIFGADRSVPDAVETGEGPTGVALIEAKDRLYVLNRFANSISIVQASTLVELDEIPLHDPSPAIVRDGRRHLYDAIDSSAHGDAACSSCHISGDKDLLAWDLGNPEGSMVPYSTPMDNVRFIPAGICDVEPMPPGCAAHLGFDPQKGPMTTQTLRGMLEPLHWRGDRPTFRDFNPAFVGLMGKEDVGPVNGKPAGLTGPDMEAFRSFALAISMQPNPFRNLDDSLPAADIQVNGMLRPGNPATGKIIFDTFLTDGNAVTCQSCHEHPFGAAGGRLGGVEPTQPTSADATGLFNGDPDGSPHSDLEVPHLRNLYEKSGPLFGAPGFVPDAKNGFGVIHDGAIPDLYRFLSSGVFTFNPATEVQEISDLVAFLFHFPTGTKPAAGHQVTLPAGSPPPAAGDGLATLIALGDLADTNRHCELTASAVTTAGLRRWHLSGGSWVTDVEGEAPVALTDILDGATSPVTFLCATIGSGERLGGNRDEDAKPDGSDCAPADPGSWAVPAQVENLFVDDAMPSHISWDDQSGNTGPAVRYDVVSGDLISLRSSGFASAACLAGGLETPGYDDTRSDPGPGGGFFYLTRAVGACGSGGFGSGRESLEPLTCP